MERKAYTSQAAFEEQNRRLHTQLPWEGSLEILRTPLNAGGKTLPNRLACQAMEGCDGEENGSPSKLTQRRYTRFAQGGAGLIWFEATAVTEEARANPRQLWIKKENLGDFQRLVEHIREAALRKNGYEPMIVLQATHSGRYSKPRGVPAPLIAYSNPLFEGENPISPERIVSDEYLDRLKETLVEAARLAQRAGFDGVDIKCCHRYLNSELLSAYQRPGRYGGSLENRTRLLRESVAGAAQVCGGDFCVTSRLNLYDGFPRPYGFGAAGEGAEMDLTEPLWLIKRLMESGVKLVNLTMGNPYVNPHVNRPFARGGYEHEEHPLQGVARMMEGIGTVKKAFPRLAVVSSALSFLGVAAPYVAAALMKTGGMDVAGFGRMAFAYPDFARDALSGAGFQKEKICLCCSKCSEMMRAGGRAGCVIRDGEAYLAEYRQACGGKA